MITCIVLFVVVYFAMLIAVFIRKDNLREIIISWSTILIIVVTIVALSLNYNKDYKIIQFETNKDARYSGYIRQCESILIKNGLAEFDEYGKVVVGE